MDRRHLQLLPPSPVGQCAPTTPTLQDMIVLAEREASTYKSDLPFCRESIRLGDHLREDTEYIKILLQVAITSFHNKSHAATLRNRPAAGHRPPKQAHPLSLSLSLSLSLQERIKSQQHVIHEYRELLTAYTEAIRAGEQLLKDVQYVRELSQLAICNFRSGMRDMERACHPSPGLQYGRRITCGHHVTRQRQARSLVPTKVNVTRDMDRPPLPRPVERIIAEAHGSSVSINAIRGNLESSKMQPALSLKEMVSFKKQEAGGFQKELAFCRETMQAGERLLEGIRHVEELLQRAVHGFQPPGAEQAETGTQLL
ncbi:hypothetical protein F5X96DRAFT_13157 [Biscogniauxia mediterranea]|nr:hypothetical protein F5X96DRAFT_13157 [Biscogniauxia mediterranea]